MQKLEALVKETAKVFSATKEIESGIEDVKKKIAEGSLLDYKGVSIIIPH